MLSTDTPSSQTIMDNIIESLEILKCNADSEGEVIATLVSIMSSERPRKALLYLHGFVDYFFQDHVAERFIAEGYAFHALDLRKYGRSLLPHQHPNFCASVSAYYEEISAALSKISQNMTGPISLLGHSTGGLIASLYCAEGQRRDLVSNLVLNSPFLEFNEPAPARAVLLPAANVVGKIAPYAILPKGLSPLYGESIHASKRGEWEYNLAWKPIEGFPVYWGWVRAIHRAQKRLHKGLSLKIPVLLLHSDASASPAKWQDNSMRADTVLNIEDMKRYGLRIGQNVTMAEIAGGMHDLYLSTAPVREHALDVTIDWLSQQKQAIST